MYIAIDVCVYTFLFLVIHMTSCKGPMKRAFVSKSLPWFLPLRTFVHCTHVYSITVTFRITIKEYINPL